MKDAPVPLNPNYRILKIDKCTLIAEEVEPILTSDRLQYYFDLLKQFDLGTYQHSEAVTFLAGELMHRPELLPLFPPSRREEVYRSCYGHDIGKIYFPEILKEEKLTSKEKRRVRKHAGESARIARELGWSRSVQIVIAHHHDYRKDLGGRLSPEIAFITHLVKACDVVHSLRTGGPECGRAYKNEYSLDRVREESFFINPHNPFIPLALKHVYDIGEAINNDQQDGLRASLLRSKQCSEACSCAA